MYNIKYYYKKYIKKVKVIGIQHYTYAFSINRYDCTIYFI